MDYITGGGLDWFTVNRKDGRDITKEMAAAGYTVALTEDELMKFTETQKYAKLERPHMIVTRTQMLGEKDGVFYPLEEM